MCRVITDVAQLINPAFVHRFVCFFLLFCVISLCHSDCDYYGMVYIRYSSSTINKLLKVRDFICAASVLQPFADLSSLRPLKVKCFTYSSEMLYSYKNKNYYYTYDYSSVTASHLFYAKKKAECTNSPNGPSSYS